MPILAFVPIDDSAMTEHDLIMAAGGKREQLRDTRGVCAMQVRNCGKLSVVTIQREREREKIKIII